MSLSISLTVVRPTEIFERNITHNLGKMADEAGLYNCLWSPEELEIKIAGELIPFLEAGLGALIANPEHYKTFNPENGWGSYNGLVLSVEAYLEACKENPDAEIHISK